MPGRRPRLRRGPAAVGRPPISTPRRVARPRGRGRGRLVAVRAGDRRRVDLGRLALGQQVVGHDAVVARRQRRRAPRRLGRGPRRPRVVDVVARRRLLGGRLLAVEGPLLWRRLLLARRARRLLARRAVVEEEVLREAVAHRLAHYCSVRFVLLEEVIQLEGARRIRPRGLGPGRRRRLVAERRLADLVVRAARDGSRGGPEPCILLCVVSASCRGFCFCSVASASVRPAAFWAAPGLAGFTTLAAAGFGGQPSHGFVARARAANGVRASSGGPRVSLAYGGCELPLG